MMVLKPSIAMNVGMILGGLLLSCLIFGLVFGFGEYKDIKEIHSVIFGLLGLLGLLAFSVGVVALVKRAGLAITINDAGIRFPVESLFSSRVVFIGRENIAAVSKHESIRGRLIEISTKSGEKVFIQARHYCELEEFLSHCEAHGFPVG